MTSTIREEKRALRKQIKEILSKIDAENVRQQSSSVTAKVLQLPEYRDARRLSIFLSMPNREVSTTEIVVDALHQGKEVFIPYIHSANIDSKEKLMDMLQLKDEQDLRNLKPDAWGIPSLSADGIEDRNNALGGRGPSNADDVASTLAVLDLIFMPGMAFDAQNRRLGHGKGFYDKYLSLIKSLPTSDDELRKAPKLVALALKEQLLPSGRAVPVNEDDWTIDRLVVAD